jgi:hypothetical protein
MDLRPSKYDIAATRDMDVKRVITVFDADGVTPHSLVGATVVADIIDSAGAQVEAIGQVISTNTLTLTITDTQMGVANTPLDQYRWVLEVTEATVKTPWLAGTFRIAPRGVTGSGESTGVERRTVLDGALVLQID